jgi:tetratricopeptide (TPR) repeat protein
MTAIADTLRVVAGLRRRRPASSLPALDALFRRLAACARADEALETEDQIWEVWMRHPHRSAEEALELATGDIAARRYDIAETRLALLLRRRPDFPEAWHKRATLFYLLGRDEECVRDVGRTLELEPRHFGALLHFGEILLGAGEKGGARFAFAAALALHPRQARARAVLDTL